MNRVRNVLTSKKIPRFERGFSLTETGYCCSVRGGIRKIGKCRRKQIGGDVYHIPMVTSPLKEVPRREYGRADGEPPVPNFCRY